MAKLKVAEEQNKNVSGEKNPLSEARLLEADDDWHAFFSVMDPEDLAWLDKVVKLLEGSRQQEHT